jgi:hypothetical protein
MTRPIASAGTKRRHGNLNWGKPPGPLPAVLTEFEIQVERLGLTTVQFIDSTQLKQWCAHNRNRCYVPEWLLKEWGLTVEDIFSGAA